MHNRRRFLTALGATAAGLAVGRRSVDALTTLEPTASRSGVTLEIAPAPADLPTIAAKLDVSTVLEGSVRRAGSRVRLTAQLIDVASDSTLWAETYDRELRDVFAIQDDIAQSIVDALKVTLSPKERRAIQYVATADVQAYDDYLRGRKYFYAWNRRDSLRAIAMYERAIARDPK